jgi:hypothetical protein
MSSQYGDKQFKEGFEIVRLNRNVAYEVNGEQKLTDMLKNLNFASDEALKSFINFTTTYLIV